MGDFGQEVTFWQMSRLQIGMVKNITIRRMIIRGAMVLRSILLMIASIFLLTLLAQNNCISYAKP